MANKTISKQTKHAIITTLVSMAIALSSYFIMYFVNFKQYENDISKKLYLVGNEQKQSIERLLSGLEREIKFIKSLEEIRSLQREQIISIFSYLTSTKKMYEEVVVVDLKGSIYYGYSESLKDIYASSYYEKSIYTKEDSFNVIYSGNQYYMEGCSPILSKDDKVVGVIYMKLSFQEIEELLIGSKQEKGLESYLVNKDGYMMTPSKNIVDAVGKTKINLKNLKINIDYSPTTVYRDYSNTDVYGRYFPIEGSDWTLVVESDYDESIMKQEKSKLVGQVAVGFQGLIILALQLFLKRRFGTEISEEDIERITEGLGLGNGGDSNDKKNK
ncbi:MAG: cache domain-containing protein [Clostridium sp.]